MQGKTMYINCRRQGFNLTEDEAQALCDLWRDTWPEVKAYFEPPKDKIKEFKDDTKLPDSVFTDDDDESSDDDDDLLNSTSDQVQTYRNCNILGMWRVEGSKNACLNFPFQSLAAVVSKHALWLVYKDSLEKGYKPIVFIHEILWHY